MLTHLNSQNEKPGRCVVIGAGGFIGGAIADKLAGFGVPVLRLGRAEIDLLAPDAAERLAGLLQKGDSVVAAAAIAPCKNAGQMRDNMRLVAALIDALKQAEPAHVVNIGSDAVFIDSPDPLREDSIKAPDSQHGAMHLAREIAFRAEIAAPLAILRPTLVYGGGDPHNGYGPNQFRRKANRGEPIALFGQGEERRDHVFIDDVAEIAARVVLRKSTGDLNLVTGKLASFHAIAEMAFAIAGRQEEIAYLPRRGPMPHNGYRPFDNGATAAAFPDFSYTALEAGMRLAQSREFPNG